MSVEEDDEVEKEKRYKEKIRWNITYLLTLSFMCSLTAIPPTILVLDKLGIVQIPGVI